MIEMDYAKGTISEDGIITMTVTLSDIEKDKFEDVLEKLKKFVQEQLNGQTSL